MYVYRQHITHIKKLTSIKLQVENNKLIVIKKIKIDKTGK